MHQTDEQAALRHRILENPDAILADRDVIEALIRAGAGPQGRNVVDLRGVLVERLEHRLGRLEHTHRTVIAAAYENLAGTQQVHRAVLTILEATDFRGVLTALGTAVPEILSLDLVRLCVETDGVAPGTPVGPAGAQMRTVVTLAPGGIATYAGSRAAAVTLRRMDDAAPAVWGDEAGWLRSEALMRLDLGPRRGPALLAFGAEDARRFSPDQGTDLLGFLGGVFERTLRRWLG